ncbi:MAG: 5-formyltetrahydrofolate cyclo-ligase [Thermoguttaceae bacterium]
MKSFLRKSVSENVAVLANRAERSMQIWCRFLDFCQLELKSRVFPDSVLGAYLNFNNEVETTPFLFGESRVDFVAYSVKFASIAVPFCTERASSRFLKFYRIDDFSSELQPHKYGILEPTQEIRAQAGRLVEPHEFGLILVPGVAFDRMGNRLGHGAGYYDSFLKTLSRSVPRVAFAFDCQVVESVPIEPHDEAVDYIITENEIIHGKKS